ncbi:MAG: hypothetical protein ACI9N1_002410 [Flavobacteriales bacterium]|jgi:hypothetical protein
MKGIVFTEFLEMVEDKCGLEVVQQVIDNSNLKTKGVYTSVGSYDHGEMVQLVVSLSEIIDTPVVDLLEVYGEHFFDVLSSSYPQFMNKKDLFGFLDSIDNYIHPEVLKIYPNAELPKFESEIINESKMLLHYSSSRKMAHFGIGLIKGAGSYYKQKLEVKKENESNGGENVTISISKVG